MISFKQLLEGQIDDKRFSEMDSSLREKIKDFGNNKKSNWSPKTVEMFEKFLKEEVKYEEFKKTVINNNNKDGRILSKILF